MLTAYKGLKQQGITVIEVMLSLAIIILILVMATRLFPSARQSQQISNAVSMMNSVVAGQAQYAVANGNTYASDICILVNGGFLSGSFGDKPAPNCANAANGPWGGQISTAPVTGGGFTVGINSVPAVPCGILDGIIKGQAQSTSGCGTSASMNYIATYQ
jgi:type II secretory pathway pseudopilin PulG